MDDIFKSDFKKFKNHTIDLDHDVIDFKKIAPEQVQNVIEIKLNSCNITLNESNYLIPIHEWRCYELKNNSGLKFIKNPFTAEGQYYWAKRCLNDYPKEPNKTNKYKKEGDLRWVTFGYHHNWDTKIYDFNCKTEFPQDLQRLCQIIASVLGYCKYNAEAAIVNYYAMKSTISGHVDRSEPNLTAPLISISFGQSAIFLIGGQTLATKPVAMRIDSGDIVVMTQESRTCYHAVPKILKTDNEPWRTVNDDKTSTITSYLRAHRINLNVRQVFENY